MPVRILTLDGVITKETFEVAEPVDRKNIVTLVDENSKRVRVHKERILPEDAFGKAAAIYHNGKYVGFCPKCATMLSVEDKKVKCPAHGEFDIVTHEKKQKPTKKTKSKRPVKKRKQEMNKENDQPTTVDLNDIAKHGSELWTKPQLKFDHAKIDVQAHVLIADEPLRKLCFNTYDGTLGKKKTKDPLVELQLTQFRDNKPGTDGKQDGKQIGYLVKGTIEDIRKQLTRAGYKKHE